MVSLLLPSERLPSSFSLCTTMGHKFKSVCEKATYACLRKALLQRGAKGRQKWDGGAFLWIDTFLLTDDCTSTFLFISFFFFFFFFTTRNIFQRASLHDFTWWIPRSTSRGLRWLRTCIQDSEENSFLKCKTKTRSISNVDTKILLRCWENAMLLLIKRNSWKRSSVFL